MPQLIALIAGSREIDEKYSPFVRMTRCKTMIGQAVSTASTQDGIAGEHGCDSGAAMSVNGWKIKVLYGRDGRHKEGWLMLSLAWHSLGKQEQVSYRINGQLTQLLHNSLRERGTTEG